MDDPNEYGPHRYPPIGDYGLIGDCHGAALVSAECSIDWCCIPRVDSEPCFGRLLDWDNGGYCSIRPTGEHEATRRYLEGTLVLETTFTSTDGMARVFDCFAMRSGGAQRPHRQLLRIIEGVKGSVELSVDVVPRFDFGELRPWIRRIDEATHVALGSNDGLVISSDMGLEIDGRYDLRTTVRVDAGTNLELSVQFEWPEYLDKGSHSIPTAGECLERLEQTIAWWRTWSKRLRFDGSAGADALRSAIVLKALTYAPTGAIVAAPTTSLPEAPGGERNWDYRLTWVRDSVFTVSSLASLGFHSEADRFRAFIQRTAAGSPRDLQVLYGIDGERRVPEIDLSDLEGYRGARPVRVGNAARNQVQLDVYGEIVELAWRWLVRGRKPDDDYWRFLVEIVDVACDRWTEPDRGIWEVRSEPIHFVHSKVMCWVAADRGIKLAKELKRDAPVDRWATARDDMRTRIEAEGYDAELGTYVRAFGHRDVDAALLLLPQVGYIDHRDERMIRTVDAIVDQLDENGLIARYRAHDGLAGREGTFLACTFWLADCLARQGRIDEATGVCRRAEATENDLGLFAEQYLADSGEMTGNFPQGLSHLAHIGALIAISEAGDRSLE